MGTFGDWLVKVLTGKEKRKAPSLVPPPLPLVLEAQSGTWNSVTGPDGRNYVDLSGEISVVNPNREPIEIVQIGIRRAGVIGAASDVATEFKPCEILPGARARLLFTVQLPAFLPSEGDCLLADVMVWDAQRRRQKFLKARFRAAAASDRAGDQRTVG